jgi:hypothetical protein
MGKFVDKKNLELPEIYSEIIKVNPTMTVNIPSTSNKDSDETTIVVEPDIANIKSSWVTKYKLTNPTLDLKFEFFKTHSPIETNEESQTRIRQLDELRGTLVLGNRDPARLPGPYQYHQDSHDDDENDP